MMKSAEQLLNEILALEPPTEEEIQDNDESSKNLLIELAYLKYALNLELTRISNIRKRQLEINAVLLSREMFKHLTEGLLISSQGHAISYIYTNAHDSKLGIDTTWHPPEQNQN